MKNNRWLIMLFCIVLIIFSITTKISAFERDEHDKYMSDVLFKEFKIVDNDKSSKEHIEALECACYITIDQFNHSGQSSLDILNNYKVKGIPSSVEQINITASPNTHRSYTHRGWDYVYYGSEEERWLMRKNILLNTVDKVFDFEGKDEKKESFCEILYYVHILGDHLHDTSYKHTNNSNGHKIGVGGRKDKEDIISKLIDNIEILFADQKHTHKYSHLISNLQERDIKFGEIVSSTGGIDSDEKFVIYQKYTQEVMDLLTMYLPEMLKEEKFFSDVFYK